MVIATEHKRYNVDYVVMAGYMRKVGVPILNTFLIVLNPAPSAAAKLSVVRTLFKMRRVRRHRTGVIKPPGNAGIMIAVLLLPSDLLWLKRVGLLRPCA